MELTQVERDLMTLLRYSGEEQGTIIGLMLMLHNREEAMKQLIQMLLNNKMGHDKIIQKALELSGHPVE